MSSIATQTVKTLVPARLDRLPWSRWHWLIIMSLGTVWILDGLEVTIKGAVGASLKDSIGFSTVQVAGSASIYLFGAISGALFWGFMTDRFGRHMMFILTLLTYMVGVVGTVLAGVWDVVPAYTWFAFFRFITGFGIGGEYAAVNSAIDELMPARVRGWVALSINGSYWVGTVFGASIGFIFLQSLPSNLAWRFAFALGGFLAVGILLLRLFMPESPRWLMTHGREEDAEKTMREIESKVKEYEGVDELPEPSEDEAIELRERESIGFIVLAKTVFGVYPRRAVAGFSILVTQAFLYNAIFFTYGLMLTTFFGVSASVVPLFLIPFAIGNFFGPFLLGRYFDSLGRKLMIPLTFWISGVLTALTGLLFWQEWLSNEYWMTVAWTVIFFFASAGASSGYLTVSETFPLEIRAMAIAFFYAIGTAAGGIAGPYIYGLLISTNARIDMFYGYLIGGGLMVLGGLMHRIFGVEAAQMSLEDIAMPLSQEEAEADEQQVGLSGPLGIDPTSEGSVRRFQEEHELEVDGIIGRRTMGALRALLQENPTEQGDDIGVDITSPDSVTAFQNLVGATADGVIGPETRGALKATLVLLCVDPGDRGSIEDFQRRFGLEPDGEIGPETQAAMRAIAAERGVEVRPRLDVSDPREVKAFQEQVGIDASGTVDAETIGALRVLRRNEERALGIDLTDADAVRTLQKEAGLPETGTVEAATMRFFATSAADRREAEKKRPAGERGRPLLDPTEPASIRRFQREHDVDEDGIVGPETQRALRDERYRTLGIDPADPASIAAFQVAHGLQADAILGPETQGAMNAERSTMPTPEEFEELLEESDGKMQEQEQQQGAEEADEDVTLLDLADDESVRRFQKKHWIPADGTVGPITQAAIRAVRLERDRSGRAGEEWQAKHTIEANGNAAVGYPRHDIWAGFAYFPAYPEVDRDLDREIEAIVASLEDDGPADDRALRARVNAQQWGPGRFKRAEKQAIDRGQITRHGKIVETAGR